MTWALGRDFAIKNPQSWFSDSRDCYTEHPRAVRLRVAAGLLMKKVSNFKNLPKSKAPTDVSFSKDCSDKS